MKGVAAAVEHERVLNKLSCSTVVDIGANRGQFALVCRRCFPASKIYSFEPLAAASKYFKNIFDDDEHTVIYECAIGDEEGDFPIHVSNREDSSSLLPIGAEQSRIFPRKV